MKSIRGLAEIEDRYDCVRSWVRALHDGQSPYPRALEAIRKLHENGLKIVILSNSSRQSTHAASKLTRMGIGIGAIHGIVTSGQLALGAIKDEMDRCPEARVLHINWSAKWGTISTADHNISAIPPMRRAVGDLRLPSPTDVDMIVAHGTDGIMTSTTDIQLMPVEALRELCIEIAKKETRPALLLRQS